MSSKAHTLSLAVICKDNAKGLEKMLKSCEDVMFDEIIVVDTQSKTDECKVVAAKFGAKVYDYIDPNQDFFQEHGFLSDFGAARNFCFSKVTSEFAMWLDSDDELIGGRLVRGHLENALKMGKNCVSMQYVYTRDEAGNPSVVQVRERIFRPKEFTWKPYIHEIPLPNVASGSIVSDPSEIRVEHEFMTLEQGRLKSIRNLAVIDYWLKKEGDIESRMWKFRGRHLLGLSRPAEALKSFQNHCDTSHLDVHVYLAKCDMADCYRMLGMPGLAKEKDGEAFLMMPQYPNACAGLAIDELMLRRFPEAIHWADEGMSKNSRTVEMFDTPERFKLMLYTAKYRGLSEQGKHADAMVFLSEIAEMYPDKKGLNELAAATREGIEDSNLYKSFLELVNALLKEGNEEKLEAFRRTAPKRIWDMPETAFLQVKKPEHGPTLAIGCPMTDHMWGPDSIKGGIGGSEEAVIFLAPLLAQKGLWVDVFANTNHKGVAGSGSGAHRWYPTEALRPKDPHDVFIGWRIPDLMRSNFKARKRYLWMHDMSYATQWGPELLENIDRVFVLSQFHKRGLLKYIPEDKIIVTQNGLDPAHFVKPDNDPKEVIYASNPNRGLKYLLQIWPEIHARTKARLHIFYGFTEWHKRMVRSNPFEQRLMMEVNELLTKTPGVVDHGMVGQMEIAQWHAKCGVWAFPTEWPEVSCITAKKAQKMGNVPVCSRYGALDETVQFGFKIGPEADKQPVINKEYMDEFKAKLLFLLENPREQEDIRKAMLSWAETGIATWQDVADQWVDIFEKDGITWNNSDKLQLQSAM